MAKMNRKQLGQKAIKTAKTLAIAKGKYDKAFRAYLRSLPMMDDERFWQLMALFRGLIHMNLCKKAQHVAKVAADEFFRVAHAKDFRNMFVDYTFAEAMEFVNTYEHWESVVRDVLDRASEETNFGMDLGDDGFGDLCDSLPVLGEHVIKPLTTTGFRTFHAMRLAANKGVGTGAYPQDGGLLVKWVFDGENYVGSALFEAAESYFISQVARKEIDKYH